MSKIPDLFLTCDPGSVGTGFALFKNKNIKPLQTWIIKGISASSFHLNRRYIWYECSKLFRKFKDFEVKPIIYIEEPQFMERGKGLTAARQGSLVKLTTTYGGIFALAEANSLEVRPLAIPIWKGQLDKKKVHARLERIFGNTWEEHVADAVGMGVFLIKGKL